MTTAPTPQRKPPRWHRRPPSLRRPPSKPRHRAAPCSPGGGAREGAHLPGCSPGCRSSKGSGRWPCTSPLRNELFHLEQLAAEEAAIASGDQDATVPSARRTATCSALAVRGQSGNAVGVPFASVDSRHGIAQARGSASLGPRTLEAPPAPSAHPRHDVRIACCGRPEGFSSQRISLPQWSSARRRKCLWIQPASEVTPGMPRE